eukprot:CAMPEP_0195524590 /NCGR_PEP_ID=MMETSP0794_2-20130614/24519_1 /TAXON_ID=515487 /ORGANISM="Stephanopyxis turris, Strain CCMP 815" /LENGTH=72 /DNA_ID=CAMNT_0040654843 /DNA_START=36 /DNA_END=254 /DNA_ORIENTATION=+
MSFVTKVISTLGSALKNKEMDVFIYGAVTAFVVCGVLPARGIDNEALKNSSYGKQYLTKYIKTDAPAAAGKH